MLTELQDMWPAVAFRIAGVQREEGLRNILSVGAANFQAVTPRMSEALDSCQDLLLLQLLPDGDLCACRCV